MKEQHPGLTGHQAAEAPDGGSTSKVVSLAAARERRNPRQGRSVRRPLVDAAGLDLDALDTERLPPDAREAFRVRVERYAQRFLRCAANFSEADSEDDDAPIGLPHVKAASRLPSLNPSAKPAQFGMGFVLDAMLIMGAATVGALCADPTMLGGSGYLFLIAAVALTVGAFVAKESFQNH